MAIQLEIANVSKCFSSHQFVLKDVSLKVQKSELLTVLGPSGSGKTTLLRIIGGLEFADKGAVFFDEKDMTHIPAGQRQIGFVFQSYALFRHMTVFENIAFGLRVRDRAIRPSEIQIKKRVQELLYLIQLPDLEKRYPAQLSGGQRQRIALARALAIDPQVLLLDEPFGALDSRVRKDLRLWLRKLQRDLGMTTILVTHDQEEALEISDSIAIMNHGRIEQQGSPEEVYNNPTNAFVIDFFGDANHVSIPRFDISQERVSRAYVKKYNIEINREPNNSTNIPATIRSVNTAGSVARIELLVDSTNDILHVEISRIRQNQLQLRVGDTVFIEFHDVRILG